MQLLILFLGLRGMFCGLKEEVDRHKVYKTSLEQFGYKIIYYPKPNNTGEGEIIGFKDYEFELLEEHFLDMNSVTPSEDYKKENVAIITILRHRKDKYVLCVANTHLYYSNSRDDIRTFQISCLLNEVLQMKFQINKVKNDVGNIDGFVLCGDLNATPKSQSIKFLLSGKNNASESYTGNNSDEVKNYVCSYNNSIQFKSAYEQYNARINRSEGVVQGKSVRPGVELGGRRSIKHKSVVYKQQQRLRHLLTIEQRTSLARHP